MGNTSSFESGLGVGTLFGLLAGALGAIAVISLVWYVLQVIAYWKIFGKMGVPGWKSIIPFYNLYIQYKMTWKPGFFWLFIITMAFSGLSSVKAEGALMVVLSVIGLVCAIAAAVILIIQQYRLAKSFGHGVGFTIGLILLEPIFMLILGFGKSKYTGNR